MQSSKWYYTIDGQQHGPVARIQLTTIQASHPDSEILVWSEGMTEWQPISTLTPAEADSTPALTDPNNPYAAPATPDSTPQNSHTNISIPTEPIPLDIGFCITQAWRIALKNLGIIIAVGLIYWVCASALETILTQIALKIDGPRFLPYTVEEAMKNGKIMEYYQEATKINGPADLAARIITQLFTLFLSLGITSFGLRLLNGESPSIAEMFSQGSKIWRTVGASILYALMVIGGSILFIFPGIYLALKFMFFKEAIVEKNLGVIDSLKYSSQLTRKNKLSLFGLAILTFLITMAGILALIVGLIWAMPCAWLATLVAYRYLHAGESAIPARIIK